MSLKYLNWDVGITGTSSNIKAKRSRSRRLRLMVTKYIKDTALFFLVLRERLDFFIQWFIIYGGGSDLWRWYDCYRNL